MVEVNRYQNIDILEYPTNAYNCHGYAWSMVSDNPVTACINFPDSYMTDGSYIKVCPTSMPAKISYLSKDHSAVTDNSANRVISKWWIGCLVRHDKSNSPFSYGAEFDYYFLTPEFGGTDFVCDHSPIHYILADVPGARYRWSSSYHFSLDTSKNSVVATPLGDGVGYIQVRITTDCGGDISLRKVINIGRPVITSQVPLVYFDGYSYNNVCNSQNYSTSMNIQNKDNVSWTRIAANPGNTSWYQSGDNINLYFYNIGQTAVFRVDAWNSCGHSTADFGFKSIYCGGSGCNAVYTVSPNPSNDKIIITPEIPAPCLVETTSSNISGFIAVYDQQGTLKKKIKYGYNSESEIDVSDLENGIYILQIYDGNSTDKKTIIVRH
jgi:hypothetical protein